MPVAYIAENVTYPALQNNTTYVMVGTGVVVNKAAEWDATDGVVYKDVTGGYGYNITGADSVIIVKQVTGNTFITNTHVKASAIVHGIDPAYTPGASGNLAEIEVYVAGWVHFPVFLNGAELVQNPTSNLYGVYRNQYLRVNVASVKGSPGTFPGLPGDPVIPSEPDEDPMGPGPVDPETAELRITIDVKPWNYLPKDVEIDW
jgi:hypothetical protein